MLVGRNKAGLEEPAAAVAALSPSTKVLSLTADLTKEADVQALFNEAVQAFGTVDVVVHAAGSIAGGPVGDLEPSTWFSDYEVNVKGSYILVHYYLKAVSEGTFIFLGTLGSSFTFPGMSAYSGSKMALLKLAEYIDAGELHSSSLSLCSKAHTAIIREAKLASFYGASWYRRGHRLKSWNGGRITHPVCS